MEKGTKKACGIGCLLIGLLGAGGLGACVWTAFMVTAPVTEASDLFLTRIGQGKVDEAYRESASTLRASSTDEQFAASVAKLGLEGYQSSSWSKRNLTNQDGSVRGTVTTKAGGEIPLAMTLRQEEGVWRVASFGSPMEKPTESPVKAGVPTDEELRGLVRASLLSLGEALKTNDFTKFHSELATAFREDHTADKLGQALSALTNGREAIASVGALEPVYDEPPSLDAAGDLKAKGHFVGESHQVRFALHFRLEQGKWNLLVIQVKVKPDKTEAVPPAEELQRMVKATLLAFNEAVKSKSFASFHSEECTPRFQAQFSPEKLTEVFGTFIERGVDFGVISDPEFSAVFKTPAAVDEHNLMKLEGRYSTQPRPLAFELEYVWVSPAWKVRRINISFE